MLSLNASLCVFEMSDIKSMQGLESVVLQLIMFLSSEAMFNSPRDRCVSIVMDEAWDLLGSDMTGKFIEALVRRGRKYRLSLIIGTQSLSDFDKTEATRVCRENCDTLVMMRQNASTIDAMAAQGKIVGGAGVYEQLKRMVKVPGRFSELAICDSEGRYIFARLMLDAYSLALYSSKAETRAAIEAAERQGLSLAGALDHVSRSGQAL